MKQLVNEFRDYARLPGRRGSTRSTSTPHHRGPQPLRRGPGRRPTRSGRSDLATTPLIKGRRHSSVRSSTTGAERLDAIHDREGGGASPCAPRSASPRTASPAACAWPSSTTAPVLLRRCSSAPSSPTSPPSRARGRGRGRQEDRRGARRKHFRATCSPKAPNRGGPGARRAGFAIIFKSCCSAGRARRSSGELRFQRPPFLLVDDELGIRALLSRSQRRGTHHRAGGERHAGRALPRARAPDLVLLDIWMPDVDGVTLLKGVGQRRPLTMPVIMMSGPAPSTPPSRATRHGASAFL